PVDPQRVDLVQRLELAFHVPPAVGKGFELGDFGAINVAHDGFPETGAAAGGGKGRHDASLLVALPNAAPPVPRRVRPSVAAGRASLGGGVGRSGPNTWRFAESGSRRVAGDLADAAVQRPQPPVHAQ